MPPIDLSELPLNWELAVMRYERDVRDDFFPDPLRNRDLFAAAKRKTRPLFDLTEYEPEAAESWDVPKGNLTLRHSIHIAAVDRLVYQALIDHLAPLCAPAFKDCSYAYRLRGPEDPEMFRRVVEQNSAFYDNVRLKLEANPNAVVVVADVAQYFENISFDILKRKLIDLTKAKLGNPTHAVIDVLCACLQKWSPYKNCGLPQNMWPSSFLGNVYLHSLDDTMTAKGYDYHRYMDDIRIVAPDEVTARRALRDLITHLREQELSVNGLKTKVVYPSSPEWKELAEATTSEFADIEAMIASGDVTVLSAAVERLNTILVDVLSNGGKPQRRLKFALNRLTSLRRVPKIPVPEPDGVAASLFELLILSPEVTPEVCEYFLNGNPGQDKAALLVRLLVDEPRCIYGWQNYHLWLLAVRLDVDDQRLLEKAREVVQTPLDTPELAGALVYMGHRSAVVELATLAPGLLDARRDSITILKAITVAVQTVSEGNLPLVVEQMALRSPTIAALRDYLGRLSTPLYVVGLKKITTKRLPDEMPDILSP
jgi:hypothetical protein